ncbi:MAG: hypothetical protein P4L10_05550 [Acidobacteriaceae bacterium]|nr:hypothetical protein [Acidobacteriaceae bacterium]
MLIAVNLASRPFIDQRPILKGMRLAMIWLAVGAIVLGLVLHTVYRKAHETSAHLRSVEVEIANVVREKQSYVVMMNRPENTRIRLDTKNLNDLFNQKAFSWTLVMEDLETALPAGVKVTEIEPILTKDGHITLHLRVLGPRDRGIEVIENMERSRCFLFPRIVSESADAPAGPNQKAEPVTSSMATNFDLLAEFNVDSANELTQPGHITDSASSSSNPQTPGASDFGQSHPPKDRIGGAIAHEQIITGVLQ